MCHHLDDLKRYIFEAEGLFAPGESEATQCTICKESDVVYREQNVASH
jgi:hypothetical protein